MDKLGIKRIIALILVVGYVGFIGYGMISGRIVPDSYIGITSLVLGYYFGKGSSSTEVKTEDVKEVIDNSEAQG